MERDTWIKKKRKESKGKSENTTQTWKNVETEEICGQIGSSSW